MARIVTLTVNPSIDVATEVERVEPDHKLRCGRPKRDPGGGGINVSRAIRELGGDSTSVITSGGCTGQFLCSLIEGLGIDYYAVNVAAETRTNLTVLERRGRQYRFIMPGGPMSAAECRNYLDALLAISPPPDYLVLSGSLPEGAPDDFYLQVMSAFAGRPTRIIVDTSGDALRAAMTARPYLVKPNRRELGELCGGAATDGEGIARAARELVAQEKAEVVAVSMANEGAVLAAGGESWFIAAPPVKPVSQIGAGDSMVAAMTLALAAGAGPRDVLRHGVAAGTAAVLTPGTELLRRSDFDRLLAEIK